MICFEFSGDDDHPLGVSIGVALYDPVGGEDLESLIARVRSPGGTTAAAFDHLDGTDFRAIFHAAVVAARDRASITSLAEFRWNARRTEPSCHRGRAADDR